VCLQYSLTRLEFVDEVVFSDEFNDIWSLSFIEDLFDVVRKVERRAYWFTDGAFFECIFYSDASLTYIA